MANKVTVNTGTLKQKAEELKNYNSSLKTKIEELSSTENSLNSMWEGEANDAFHSAFTRDIIQMNNFYNAIERYVTVLNETAARYESAESANTNIATQRNY